MDFFKRGLPSRMVASHHHQQHFMVSVLLTLLLLLLTLFLFLGWFQQWCLLCTNCLRIQSLTISVLFLMFSFVLVFLQMSSLYTTQTQRSGIRTRTRRKLNDSQQRVVTQNSSSSPVSCSCSCSSSVPSAGFGWCGLCGDGGGWMSCGRCMGEGGFSTRSGLAGIKGKVGWARCKLCYGHKFLPCLLCGISKSKDWKDCKAPLPPCSENKNLQ